MSSNYWLFQYDKVIPIKQTNKYLGTCKGLATHQRRVAKYNFNSQLVHQSQSVSDQEIKTSITFLSGTLFTQFTQFTQLFDHPRV